MSLNMRAIETEVNRTKNNATNSRVLWLLLTKFMWEIKTLKYVSAYKLNGNGWLSPSDGPENDRERGKEQQEERGRRTKEPKYQRTSGLGLGTAQRLLQEYQWHHALHKFFSRVTWVAAVELKWDPDGEQAWPGPNLATQGRRAAPSPSAETVSVVPGSHMDDDWSSTESACIPKSIFWFKSSRLNCKLNIL